MPAGPAPQLCVWVHRCLCHHGVNCHHALVTMEPSNRAGESEFFRLTFPFSSLIPFPNFSLATSVSYFAVPSMGETGVGPPLHTALFKIYTFLQTGQRRCEFVFLHPGRCFNHWTYTVEEKEDMANWQKVLKENVLAIMQKSKLKPANQCICYQKRPISYVGKISTFFTIFFWLKSQTDPSPSFIPGVNIGVVFFSFHLFINLLCLLKRNGSRVREHGKGHFSQQTWVCGHRHLVAERCWLGSNYIPAWTISLHWLLSFLLCSESPW